MPVAARRMIDVTGSLPGWALSCSRKRSVGTVCDAQRRVPDRVRAEGLVSPVRPISWGSNAFSAFE